MPIECGAQHGPRVGDGAIPDDRGPAALATAADAPELGAHGARPGCAQAAAAGAPRSL
jgi:hypothetical protein